MNGAGSTTAARRAAVSIAPTERRAGLVISWSVSRGALLNARPAEALFPDGRPEIASAGPDLEVRWRIEPSDAPTSAWAWPGAGRVELFDPAANRTTLILAARGAVEVHRDDDTGLVHIEANDLLLSATVRVRGDEDARVLYARTGVLAMLGLGGGRYELVAPTSK